MVIRRLSGRVVELSTVWVSANMRPRRNRRKGSTSAQKQDANERDCVKRLARVINCNFSHGDLLLTPKYDEAGMARLTAWAAQHQGEGQSWEDALLDAAEREGRNYMRRLGRALNRQGAELRYILITSDIDGETGEAVRLHHHIIIPRVGYELAARLWPLGTVDYQILRAQDDYTPLAEYLCRQVRRRPDSKKYTSSRNLKKPIVNERWARPGEELKPDRDGLLLHRGEWEPGKPQYIRFMKGGRNRSGKPHAAQPPERDSGKRGGERRELSDPTGRARTGTGGTSAGNSGGGGGIRGA